jgi:hypothetical protein
MILWFRWFFTALVYHIGVGYASYLAIRNPSDIRTLKLCIIVGMLTMTSYALGDAISMVIPMFYEARAMLIWGLLVVEPSGWNDMYDAAVGPVIQYVIGSSRVLSRTGISKRALLWGVDLGTFISTQAVKVATVGGALQNPGRADMALGLVREEVAASKAVLGPLPSLSNLYTKMSQYNEKKEVLIQEEKKVQEEALAATINALSEAADGEVASQ